MKINQEDIVGEQFGRLTILSIKKLNGRTYAECKCDCGKTKTVRLGHLKSGDTKSCGCLQAENRADVNLVHGCARRGNQTRLYIIWGHMNARCKDKSNHLYGGRGISVCDEWKMDFTQFEKWAILNGYSDELSIDRINSNEGYCPGNCRWSTPKEQSRNKRNSRILSYEGISQTVADWADQINEDRGMQKKTFKSRIDRGWSIEAAIERPLKKYKTQM